MIEQQAEPEAHIPEAIAESTLVIGDQELRVYVLDDGRRVIAAEDIARFFGIIVA
jgi:hypothetical protein